VVADRPVPQRTPASALVPSAVLVLLWLLLVALVAWVNRDMGPFYDEWGYLCQADWTNIGYLMAPHGGGHWVFLHVLIYRTAAELLGAYPYPPLLLPVLLAHLALVLGVLRLTGSVLAAALVLWFGTGWLNLFWAFQVGFVAAAALGVWGLIAISAGRSAVGSLLLLAGVATQGDALFFIPAAGVVLLAQRRQRELPWIFLPAIAWSAWAILNHAHSSGASPTPLAYVDYLGTGALFAIGLGMGPIGTVGVLSGLLAARGRPGALTLATGAGLLSEFAILALVRQGVNPPTGSHYQYVAAVFVVIALADIRRTARHGIFITAALVIGLAANTWLMVANGLQWPRAALITQPQSTFQPSAQCVDRWAGPGVVPLPLAQPGS
jgi:hypothetical protein